MCSEFLHVSLCFSISLFSFVVLLTNIKVRCYKLLCMAKGAVCLHERFVQVRTARRLNKVLNVAAADHCDTEVARHELDIGMGFAEACVPILDCWLDNSKRTYFADFLVGHFDL
jgi:hypothetical protein